jgi:geranylgeranyl diphosphate synthase type II
VDIKKYLQEKKEIVEEALEKYFSRLPAAGDIEFSASLRKAMQYSLFSGGKRIRPILSLAALEAVGGKGDRILPFACALEMIHTYSLIHDDLPAIDNDDYRRGKLTCHKLFGEAIGVLAGDALLTEAFKLMSDHSIQEEFSGNERLILGVINEVAYAAGMFGMVGGQVLDVESAGKEVDPPTIQYIHTHKTGALIVASVRMGAKIGGAKEKALRALTSYGEKIGLAFQISDDVLNVEGDAIALGKSTGSDRSKGKATYPSVFGLTESKKRAGELVESAVNDLRIFGKEADPLREIARFIISREY